MSSPLPDEIAQLRAQLDALSRRVSRTEHATDNLADSLDELETELRLAREHLAAAADTDNEPPPPPDEPAPEQAKPPPPAPEQASAPQPGKLDITTLRTWVESNITRWAQRKLARHPGQTGFLWCTQWHQHTEAVTLLWALHLAWLERANQPGAAMLEYFLHYLYPTLATLGDPLGPFHACAGEHHTNPPPLQSPPPRPQ